MWNLSDTIIDMITYNYNNLNLKDNIKPEESFTDAYVAAFFESEILRSSTKTLCTILYAKYKR